MVRLRALRSFGIQPFLKGQHLRVPDPNFPLFYNKGDIVVVPFSQAIRLIAAGHAARVTEDDAR
ncbi:hypothetical protein [Occallatibacter savannae]|uniref:hypothetical protein n=1 Tax=Occallatibacter savannae TaxID=1002691 RepID=UPI00194EF45A|nr:hypothetical protein [Occallatibacter savannae]